ncbi:two-component system, OmpR family, KDP operon response regulator KdpE [Actinacidiphila alni]|uniref:Two-component system, OmpR family, KDP operon response regulator KdpE n=1 Tax=Actinacidiphila alni TaxID=380248 RepID=A0A1I1YG59_9ACTN|nr:response regulator [Actinacidiphila alni]SFE18379.1 two-component system, OmpR family, KDP operon response regulator KdpE [Actinacidiphila alni]
MRHILVVDDDPPMLRALGTGLRAHDFDVTGAADAGTALDLAARRPPEAVLLDLGLPDLDGLDVLRALRAWSSVPVLVVSGRTGVSAHVAALDAGADDYITKPFAVDELAARLRAVLRRPAQLRPREQVELGAYTVDLARCTVLPRTDPAAGDGAGATSTPSEGVHLTPTEWRLLTVLLRNPERVVTGRDLLTEVWGPEHVTHTNYLRIYLAGLRRKLEPEPSAPRHLITEPGLGYRFQP